ncbi:hypothetical protein [Actinacidiphila sp. ITFR-21]|uniref:hypothetical protein n=1 Tax=Actinacidiphila sp. ITFR-21 TaxID=3075199 RepID=UPI00288A5934|nr:hypothetical protein [Streptomyces sp. ITFR-21]WNI15484.1 hypothetical protein RLT57_08050 [Streptomyces sp. ITFR-21]
MRVEGESSRPGGQDRDQGPGRGDGWLVVAIRMPARVLALVVVLPVRLLWDVLCAAGRAARTAADVLGRRVLYPPARLLAVALAWLVRVLAVVPLAALGRYVLVPAGRVLAWAVAAAAHWLLAVPAAALWTYVLAPLGRGTRWCLLGLGAVTAWLVRVLVAVPAGWLWRVAAVPLGVAAGLVAAFLLRWLLVVPLVALWRYAVTPAGRGARWVLRGAWRVLVLLVGVLVVAPSVFVWRRVLVPVGREVGAAFVMAWRMAAFVSRAVGCAIGRTFRVLVAVPAVWVWRRTGGPFFRALGRAARWTRLNVLRPVREAVADARRTVRTAVFGTSAARPRGSSTGGRTVGERVPRRGVTLDEYGKTTHRTKATARTKTTRD